ncbi:Glycolipid transfer protein [Labeo rohita]|uniref:Glycolipid transfer protein n=1 Tax=Labeo rohita TaxID=84645 RepID=A0ABQ8MPV2_LABRO|nr:Glycolipid transfer protein [Labeo rohita]
MALLMEHQFRQLPADKQVETRPFLEAVSHLPPFFAIRSLMSSDFLGYSSSLIRDCLGSTIFSPIKADIVGNITKIKAVYDTNPTRFKTLQHILEAEKEMHGTEWPKVGATLALMGLRFIQVLLQSLVDGDKDESNPNLIRAALYAAPYRSDFLKALSKGREVKDEECLDKVRQFLVNFTATIDAIYEMYTKMNAELDYTV